MSSINRTIREAFVNFLDKNPQSFKESENLTDQAVDEFVQTLFEKENEQTFKASDLRLLEDLKASLEQLHLEHPTGQEVDPLLHTLMLKIDPLIKRLQKPQEDAIKLSSSSCIAPPILRSKTKAVEAVFPYQSLPDDLKVVVTYSTQIHELGQIALVSQASREAVNQALLQVLRQVVETLKPSKDPFIQDMEKCLKGDDPIRTKKTHKLFSRLFSNIPHKGLTVGELPSFIMVLYGKVHQRGMNLSAYLNSLSKLERGKLVFSDLPLLQEDEYALKIAAKQDGWMLLQTRPELKENEALVRTAIAHDGMALAYAADRFRGHEEIVKRAILQNPFALQYAMDGLNGNKALVKLAVALDGLTLEYASAKLRDDPEIVQLALLQNPQAIQYAGPHAKAQLKGQLS